MATRVRLIRRTVLCFAGIGILFCAGAVVAQTSPVVDGADALGPAFEVAAIRPASADSGGWVGIRVDPSGRVEAHGVELSSLVWQAYGDAPGKSSVVTDRTAPKWMDSETFDVNAKVEDAYLSGDKLSDQQRLNVVRPMLRRLLADRFHLKMRVEMRKTPVYAMVQAKGGAHVKEVPAPVAMEGDPDKATTKWIAENPGKGVPGGWVCSGETCIANAVKISDAIGQIMGSSGSDRMVIDETGLTGYYDFSFRFAVPKDADVSPMQAVEEDLGGAV